MAKLLLLALAAIIVVAAPAHARLSSESASEIPTYPQQAHSQAYPSEHEHRPLDERCQVLKDQLEFQLQKGAKERRLFEARLANNAGTRFCREGYIEHGIAEFKRGLSFLDAAAP